MATFANKNVLAKLLNMFGNCYMRKLTTILILLLLFHLFSCERGESTEEGEKFLKKIECLPDSCKVQPDYHLTLLESEDKYCFTVEQLLRLKKLQLTILNSVLTKDDKEEIYNEIEKLAVKTGNDSILINYRAFVFHAMCWNFTDNADLVKILERDKALLVKNKKFDILGTTYYLGISMNYRWNMNYEMANYYAFKNRPYTKNIETWYLYVAENMLDAKRYSLAIAYADSAIITKNINAYSIKCRALVEVGKKAEALSLYKNTENLIENCRDTYKKLRLQNKISKEINYSFRDCYVLYNYALLLKQAGDIKESIRVLNKISFFIQYEDFTNNTKNIAKETSINIPRLLSECYNLLGDIKQSKKYSLRADSILVEAKRIEVNRVINGNSQKLSRLQLSNVLAKNDVKLVRANIAQYVMISVIILLLTLIVLGWLWWKERSKRIQKLFEQILYKHKIWSNLQLSAPNIVEEELPKGLSKHNIIPPHYPGIYRKLNFIMKDKALFLNPQFELATLSYHAGINRTLLSNILNCCTGMNFKDWLAEYRVNYLLEQIKINPNKEISELYLQAGFTSRATFFRQFRNVTGLTPKQYMSKLSYNDCHN